MLVRKEVNATRGKKLMLREERSQCYARKEVNATRGKKSMLHKEILGLSLSEFEDTRLDRLES